MLWNYYIFLGKMAGTVALQENVYFGKRWMFKYLGVNYHEV